jgi:hypothetical protein
MIVQNLKKRIILISALFRLKLIFKIFLISILTIFLTLTLIKGAIKTFKTTEGQDFQYSPAKLFWEGTNHYEYILNKKDELTNTKKIILSQNGEYSHILYIIFYPFTLTNFENAKKIWVGFNCLFAALLPFILGKYLKLRNIEILLSILLFFASYPVRSTIGNGQQSLFILLFYCIPFIFNSNLVAFLSGIAYTKYNLGISLFFYFLSNYKKLLLSLLPSLIGWFFYCYYTDSNLIKNIFEIIQLALTVTARPETAFSFIGNISYINQSKNVGLLIILAEILICLILIFKINKNVNDRFYKLALVSLSAITFLPHWGHDYVFLLPLALISYKNFYNPLGKINIIFIIYFIYLQGYMIKFFKLINFNFFEGFAMPKSFLLLLLINLFSFKKFKFTN